MPLKKLLGSKATRSLTVVSVLNEAKRAFTRGKRTRGVLLLGVAVLAWKWTMLGLAAQGILKLLRGGRTSSASPS
ncbi:hypothetical protein CHINAEXTREME_03675 [Halobiforma lacisalsi AJ5]|uniref:Uncharacterized protein n=1 Tax=Natronobacterium lacisalsi AJ5 TaxID=358396 RepID=M0LNE1_NATLA|nr:hypothetical protein [Halobiforma lacisalsi]APW96923.1 hypothetical protein CHINAEXTREME_03675 [Halobiforma lacisalsi AJ5]EMA34633.1 hypothetical protein C445_06915 [Halobiforma lacisalsi AJ5]